MADTKMSSHDEEAFLLTPEDGLSSPRADHFEKSHHNICQKIEPEQGQWRLQALKIGFIASCTCNALFLLAMSLYFFQNTTGTPNTAKNGERVEIPSVTGLQFDKPTQYKHNTEFGWHNLSLSEERWDSLSTDPLIVALPDSWADAHGLPRSARWPWDPSRGRYFIRAFHELHCLKYIRRYVLDWQEGKGEVLVGKHTLHCLDSLRQSVMCRADDTLQVTSDDTTFAIGDQQYIMCRDWDKLVQWSQSLDRHACHHSIDDYRTIKHSIERYAFCPDDSPYKSIQEEYFREHSHRNPWE